MPAPQATYLPDLSRPLDRLRADIGDTNTVTFFFPDVTYTAELTRQANDEVAATISMAQRMISKLAQMPVKSTIGPDSKDYSERTAYLERLIKRLSPKVVEPSTVAAKKSGIAKTEPSLLTLCLTRTDNRRFASTRLGRSLCLG
jgi:hypothetical protein